MTNKNKNQNKKINQNRKGRGKVISKTSVDVPPMSSQAYSVSDDVGGVVGRGIAALGKWLGFGAYSVNNNTVIGAGGSIPSMHSTNDSVIIRHREYVGDILSSTTFASTQIALNPGLISTFPWLGRAAQCFQQYKILGMVVEYMPLISDGTSNELSMGFVTLAADYRTDLPTYPSQEMALESQWAVSTKPSHGTALAIECDPKQSIYNSHFIRTGAVPSGQDPKTYDFVNLSVIVGANQTASVVLGQLWITYEVELLRPTAFLDPPNQAFYIHWFNTVGISSTNMLGTVASGNFTYYNNPVGTNQIGSSPQGQATSDGVALANTGTGTYSFTLPRGVTGFFQLYMFQNGVAVNNAGMVVTLTRINCSAASIFESAASVAAPVGGTASTGTTFTSLFSAFTITDAQAAAGQAVLTFGSATNVALTTSVDVYIFQCNTLQPIT